ncbi:MAG: hypothetical protein GX434_12665 [Peptococcaceae bacterium]|nr:hypothetical protein [Peptococcaceae bacterium]
MIYEYVRQRYSFLAKQSSQYLWELGTAYLRGKGVTDELSRGMGFYFLELGIKTRHTEMTQSINKEDCL